MARTSTAVSRPGTPAGLRQTWAVLVGLLLSGAVCLGLLAGGAPAAASTHRAISTASGQASGSAGTEQRQRTPSRRTHSQPATRTDRSAQAAQASRAVPAARATRPTRPVAQVIRTPHGVAAKSVGGDRAPPTARGSAHAPGSAHPATWAITAERPDPYVRAGHTYTDRDHAGHPPAALGGSGVRAPPGPHAA